MKSSSINLVILISFLTVSNSVTAQEQTKPPIQPTQIASPVTFMTPTATSLGRYAMQPPNLSNGLPQESISLYDMKENGIDYPIELYYNYSGFRPNDEANYVGLGWGITEGSITRIVKGLADENNSIYKKFETFNSSTLQSESYQNYDLTANRIFRKLYDAQPDIYVYNFGGHSGRFFWLNGQAYLFPYCDLKIKKQGTNFIIDTPDGLQYSFIATDHLMDEQQSTNCGTFDYWDSYYAPVLGDCSIPTYTATFYTTTWRISEVLNKNTKSQINISYEYDVWDKIDKHTVESFTFWSRPDANVATQFTDVDDFGSYENLYYSAFRPVEITSNDIDIKFSYTSRQDFTEAKALDNIKIFSTSNLNSPIKSVQFNYGYFGSGNPNGTWLKLKDISLSGGGDDKGIQFSYVNEDYFPPNKDTYSIDHWGYYNGKNNTNLVPLTSQIQYILQNRAGPSLNWQSLAWANRDPDFDYAKYFALSKVTYPTGGFTKINFETADSRGIRVFSIEDNDGQKSECKYFSYHSAAPVQIPDYKFDEYETEPCNANIGALTRYPDDCASQFVVSPLINLTITGTTRSSLDFLDESTNFYDQVTEYIGTPDGKGGKKVYNFIRDDYYFEPSLTEEDDFEYALAQPVKKIIYQYEKQSLQNIGFFTDPQINTISVETQVIIQPDLPCPELGTFCEPAVDPLSGYPYILSNISVNTTSLTTEWNQLKETDSYVYEKKNNSYIEESTKFYYKDIDPVTKLPIYCSPVKTEKNLSDGRVKTTNLFYPGDDDPDNPGTKLGPSEMWDATNVNYKYCINPVIKSNTYIGTTPANSDETGFTYDRSNNLLLKTSYKKYPTATSTDNISYAFSYNSNANLIEYQKENDMNHSYLWDYNNTFPIAEVINSGQSDMAYTSFEADGKGNWNNFTGTITTAGTSPFPATGNKYYNLTPTNTLSKPVTSGRTYIISYWSKNGKYSITNGSGTSVTGRTFNDWTYYEHKIIASSSTLTITGTGAIDEVRLYPFGAQMTTYTYAPLIGITSQCDANNRVTYYEYDNFQRLKLIRDQDKNILKKICYNYAGQAGQCNAYASAAISGDYYSQNCSSGQSPVAYQVSVPQGMFTSAVDQPTANQLAEDYAQNQANQHGTCMVLPVSVYAENNHGTNITVQLHNISSGQNYLFVVYAYDSGILGDVPPGSYDITLTSGSSTEWFNYSVGCGYYNDGSGSSSVIFYGVPLSSGCNSILID